MARGSIAKNSVADTIKQAFGNSYIGVVDGKIYVWADDGGERVQIAISMTCPKNFVEAPAQVVAPAKMDFGGEGGWDFEAMDKKFEVPEKKAEVSQEEQDNIAELMRKLGLL